MSKSPVLVGAVVLLFGGGAVAYALSGSDSLDAFGLALWKRGSLLRSSDDPNRSDCRGLLVEIRKHPSGAIDDRLIRTRAWLNHLLGKSMPALDMIELIGEKTDEDQLLAAQILQRRHAESGEVVFARQAAAHAEEHYDATNAPASLLLCWQMSVRAGSSETERRERCVRLLRESHPDSLEGRSIVALEGYLLDLKAENLDLLLQLDNEFTSSPEELSLAIAWLEIGRDTASLERGSERVSSVLAVFPSSIDARNCALMAAFRRRDWKRADQSLSWLLRRHADHVHAPNWRNMRTALDAEIAKSKNASKNKASKSKASKNNASKSSGAAK